MAAKLFYTAAMKEIWHLAKDNLTREEKNKLLATSNEGNNAWHMAVDWGRTAAMKEIWDLAKYVLTIEEINKLLSATNIDGNTA
jgi:hypothetical protein